MDMRSLSPASKRALIVGGGLGGLSMALALQQRHWNVRVYEKAPELREIGAGIVLPANAMHILEKFGVADRVRALGSPVKKAEIRTWDGKRLLDVPVHQQAQRYGSYSYLIHRPLLQGILYDRLQPDTVVFDKKLYAIEQEGEKITGVFSAHHTDTGDVLIGADGVHSAVRRILWGDISLRYAGFTAIRGISRFVDERFPVELGGGFEAWGRGKRFGFSHLGQGLLLWFAAVNVPEGFFIRNFPSTPYKKIALDLFRGWWHPIEAVIASTAESSILVHDVFDFHPLKKWGRGCATLLGDAAHAMLPNLGQGGAQAWEDAWTLARCLDEYPQISEAFWQYERLRIPRTTHIVHRARRMGAMMQREHPFVIALRNAMLRVVPVRIQMKQLDSLMRYTL